ncbi:MAG: hypothetical protein PUJ55_05705 [Clostridiales bacterium]|nr:hypothetical protein [Roseburia sp.]MDD7636417.1 hypothetical protein [Clostridiales bacterium]
MGSVASGGLKIFTAGVGAAAAGVTALGTAAVKSYADYEQLFGGIETLFGNGGKTLQEYADSVGKTVEEVKDEYVGLTNNTWNVVENAEKAFKTAGLSTNEYLETVTSFSASLIQSLNGDTVKAAEKADQAIIDMSDNANKMGSSMESIQNAYQGFAKQNYTMLDNLKLGYGGTKEEMQRLLADAQAISGIKYDISSYADVVDAIHVIQDEMGITGTTAKEAATTISGSISSMKASWANLVAGLANEDADPETLINNFVESVEIVAENVLPHVEIALYAIADLIEELLPIIAQRIPDIINEILPDLVESGINMISSLATGLQQNLPQIMSAGGEILSTLANGIVEVIPTLASTAYDIVMNLLSGITNNADSMLNGGSELLLEFITGIAQKIPDLLVAGVEAVISLAMALTDPDTLGNIISAGIELILGLLEGLMNAIPKLLEAAPILMARLVSAIIENIPKLLSAAVTILTKLAQYMVVSVTHLLAAVPQLFLSLVNSFKSMDWGSIGKNIVDGIWNGISSGWNWLVDQVKNLASNLFNAAKEALDIHSPSRKFEYLGKMCVAGFDDGMDDLMNPDAMTRNINASMSTMKANMSGARATGGIGGFGNFNQTINVNQQISTPDELARAVRVESRYGLMRGVAFG